MSLYRGFPPTTFIVSFTVHLHVTFDTVLHSHLFAASDLSRQTPRQSSYLFTMVSYRKSYVFPLALTDAWKEQITIKAREKLTEMLGVEVDDVMAVRVP